MVSRQKNIYKIVLNYLDPLIYRTSHLYQNKIIVLKTYKAHMKIEDLNYLNYLNVFHFVWSNDEKSFIQLAPTLCKALILNSAQACASLAARWW